MSSDLDQSHVSRIDAPATDSDLIKFSALKCKIRNEQTSEIMGHRKEMLISHKSKPADEADSLKSLQSRETPITTTRRVQKKCPARGVLFGSLDRTRKSSGKTKVEDEGMDGGKE